MNLIKITIMGLALASTVAMAECDKPDAPKLPNGAKATMEDMLAGQKAVKAFQEVNLEYMGCLEKIYTAAEKAALEGSDDAKAKAQKNYSEAIDAYNDAVSKEEEVAGQFNTEIREYKAANPG